MVKTFTVVHKMPRCLLIYSKISFVLPINGIDSLVSGIFSAIASMKTLKARMTVTPRAIFSPESGGRQKTRTVRLDIIIHGNTMLYM